MLKLIKKHNFFYQKTNRKISQGQMTMEFIFSMIVLFLMIFGTVMIFRWTGLDMADRRIAHDHALIESIKEDYGMGQRKQGPMKQLDTFFYTPRTSMNAIWRGQWRP